MIVEQVKTTIAGIALAIAVIITGFATWSITSNHYKVRILQTNLAGCNANTNTAGGNTSTSSMGDAATVELSAIAADTIFSIREGIISDQAKLVYLQSYVKDIVKQCKRL